MNDWYRKYPFKDYDSAITHLDKRAKRVRNDAPLAHAVRLVRHFVDDRSVSVIYHQTPIVTFWDNGSQALHWGGWYTKTTLEHIQRYANLGDLRLSTHQRDKHGRGEGVEWYFARYDWPRTPSRITACRRCKGKGSAPSRHMPETLMGCYNCAERGEVERGRQVIPEVSTGDALMVWPASGSSPASVTVHPTDGMPTYECKCSLCRCGCESWGSHWSHTQTVKQHSYTYSPPTSTSSPHDMGSEVADELTELLPGLLSKVQCPRCTAETFIRPVRDMIVHLNDHHRVSREVIADWLDALDVDLRFPTPAFS